MSTRENDQVRFQKQTYTSNEVLELVHTNLCGPIEVQSYKGDKYIILFVDDYSSHVPKEKVGCIPNVQVVLG